MEEVSGEPTGTQPPTVSHGSWSVWRLFAGRSDWISILVLIAGYAALITYLSNLRWLNFFTSAWDLGINQQLLWTTAHGRLLYETADLEFYNAHSFLQVHSAYVAFLVAPIYAAWPSPLTLFIVQSTVFAASALPLYYLARSQLERRELAFGLVVLYLASFAVTSGLMYDFHWESFLPVEFFAFFVLVNRRRYALSLVPLAFGTLTLEVFPFLAGGVLVLALLDRAQASRFRWRPLARDRDARLVVGLFAIVVVAYGIVRLVQLVVLPDLLGVPSVTGGGPGGVTEILGIGFGANWVTLPHSLAYWALLLASLGFLPLLSPRHLVLTIPWFFFSVFVSPVFSANFGGAQALIAIPPLLVGSVFGLRELERSGWEQPRTLAFLLTLLAGSLALALYATLFGGSVPLLNHSAGAFLWAPCAAIVVACGLMGWLAFRSPVAPSATSLPVRPRRYAAVGAAAAVLVTLLAFDTALSPFVPGNFSATPIPGYQFQFGENPNVPQMPWITAYLPNSAQVLASDRLFPYVANDPNAWPVPWFVISSTNPVPFFPFTPTNLPNYVLVDAQEFPNVPQFLQQELFNSSVYGLVAYIYGPAAPAPIYLFEHGFHGTPSLRDIAPAQATFVFTSNNLSVGSSGVVQPNANSASGKVIQSTPTGPVAGLLAPVWYGPYRSFLPGNYTVTYSLSGALSNTTAGTKVIGFVDATWQGDENISSFFREPINASELSPTGWTTLTIGLHLAYPYPMVEFRGFLALVEGRSIGSVTLNSITVTSEPA